MKQNKPISKKMKRLISESVKSILKEWLPTADYQGNDLDYETIKMEAEDALIKMQQRNIPISWQSIAKEMGFQLKTLNSDDIELLKDTIEEVMLDNNNPHWKEDMEFENDFRNMPYTNESVSMKNKLRKIIGESIKNVLKESDELPYLSDKDIHKQYEGFELEDFTIKPKKFRYGDGYGWEICFGIHFPNVDHPDFDDFKWENVDVWDEEGKRITWDGWYPEDIEQQLISMIRSEIQKHMGEMEEFKAQTNKGIENESLNRKINRIVNECVKRNLR